MNREILHQHIKIPDRNLPIIIDNSSYSNCFGTIFDAHWHEQIELLFFTVGEADILCDTKRIHVQKNDLLVINSNEMHCEESNSKLLQYFCIIIDISLIQSGSFDTCDTKYITPISNNFIYFNNKISNDSSIINCVNSIITEYKNKELGYELAIKSHVYNLFVILLRNHIDKILNRVAFKNKAKNAERLELVLNYINENYSEKISIEQLAKMISISPFRFCHIFKEITKKSLGQYVNSIRINNAEKLLKSTNHTITEVAYETGFDNINYFSRIFKEKKGISPSKVRKIKPL